MDAREFLKNMAVNADNKDKLDQQFRHFDHVYMNLPADAVEFLDIFKGFLHYADKDTWNLNNLPMIHVYGFESGDSAHEIKEKFTLRIKKAMTLFSVDEILDIHTIKDVSSLKKMYCVRFKLSKEVALYSENNMFNDIANYEKNKGKGEEVVAEEEGKEEYGEIEGQCSSKKFKGNH